MPDSGESAAPVFEPRSARRRGRRDPRARRRLILDLAAALAIVLAAVLLVLRFVVIPARLRARPVTGPVAASTIEYGHPSTPAGAKGASAATSGAAVPASKAGAVAAPTSLIPGDAPSAGQAGAAAAASGAYAGRPVVVHGLYMPAGMAGDVAGRRQIVALLKRTGLNALVIDIKEADGIVYYRSQVPLAVADHLSEAYIPDLPGFLADLRQQGIYAIARIVTFKDISLARHHPDWAVHTRTGAVWRDRTGAAWMDPDRPEVRRYNVDLGVEAIRLGFREVQYDYVRYPSDGDLSNIAFAAPPSPGETPAQVIAAFLREARTAIHAAGGAISADVFGLVPSAQDDLGIGQRWQDVAAAVDYISPMAYPSHYALGTFGLPDPDAAPAATVSHTMADALRRLPAGGALVRPWLQDFSLRHHYGVAEVVAQIQAADRSGAAGWLIWNPACDYHEAALSAR